MTGPTPKPIFLVGSLRSGVSLLSLALGQHRDLTAVMSNLWLEPFAIGLHHSYRAAIRHRRTSQIDIAGIELEDFFAHFGPAVLAMMRSDLDSNDSAPRLVDVTQGNAFLITALRLLFPEARFIHIVRDVHDVATTLADVTLQTTYGSSFFRCSERQAYDHWQRTVGACLAAEHAFGSSVVLRIRRTDLVLNPEATLRRCLAFLGEDFDDACLRPFSSIPTDVAAARPELEMRPAERADAAAKHAANLLSDVLMEQGEPFSPGDENAIDDLRAAMWETWTKGKSLIPLMAEAVAPAPAAPKPAPPAPAPPPAEPAPNRFARMLRRPS